MNLAREHTSTHDERGGVTTEVVVAGSVFYVVLAFAIGILRGLTQPGADVVGVLMWSAALAAGPFVAVGLLVLVNWLLVERRVHRVTGRMSMVGPTFSDLRFEFGLPSPGPERIDATLEALREYWERNPHESLASIVDRHAGALNRELGIRRPARDLEDEALLAMLRAGTNSSSQAARAYVRA